MNITNWHVQDWEISLAGKTFFVSAVFDFERDSVDYQFNPSTMQGRDRIGMVACDVLALEIYGEEDSLPVEISLVSQIRSRILELFRNSEEGCQLVGWGRWM